MVRVVKRWWVPSEFYEVCAIVFMVHAAYNQRTATAGLAIASATLALVHEHRKPHREA